MIVEMQFFEPWI